MSSRIHRAILLSSSASIALCCLGDGASSQDAQPTPQVQPAPAPQSEPPPTPAPQSTPEPASQTTTPTPGQLPRVTVTAPAPRPARPALRRPAVRTTRTAAPTRTATTRPLTPTQQVAAKNATFDTARQSLLTTVGTTLYPVSHEAIQQMPQGDNQPIDKVLLQTPGVSQDSAASGTLHVRNEHGNVQYRINGIFLPDGVSGLATFLDTAVIGNMSLITGALPAEYGLRSAGLIDIQTRTDVFNNTGSVGVYGGSQRTFTAGIEYGGTYAGDCASTPATPGYFVKSVPSSVGGPCAGATQYFFMARYLQRCRRGVGRN